MILGLNLKENAIFKSGYQVIKSEDSRRILEGILRKNCGYFIFKRKLWRFYFERNL